MDIDKTEFRNEEIYKVQSEFVHFRTIFSWRDGPSTKRSKRGHESKMLVKSSMLFPYTQTYFPKTRSLRRRSVFV